VGLGVVWGAGTCASPGRRSNSIKAAHTANRGKTLPRRFVLMDVPPRRMIIEYT